MLLDSNRDYYYELTENFISSEMNVSTSFSPTLFIYLYHIYYSYSFLENASSRTSYFPFLIRLLFRFSTIYRPLRSLALLLARSSST